MSRLLLVTIVALGGTAGCDNDVKVLGPIDGKVWMDAPPSVSCETTTPWAAAPGLTRGPTQETATVAVDAKIYVIGGFDQNAAVISAVQVFDTVSCTWTDGPNVPKAVHHANVAVVGGTIYVVGAMQTLQFTAIPDVWSYNPATDATWNVRTSMPAGTQRGSALAGVIDDKIYVAGGLRGGAVAELSMYDPAQDMWTTALPPLPAARDHGCGGVVAGKLYVTGGRQGGITTQSPIVYEYTPGGTWVEKAPMPTARGGTACGVIGNRIIVIGGEGNQGAPSGVFPQVEAYDAVANTWASLADMPTPRHGMGAAASNGRLYVPGGATEQGFGAVATHEVLTP